MTKLVWHPDPITSQQWVTTTFNIGSGTSNGVWERMWVSHFGAVLIMTSLARRYQWDRYVIASICNSIAPLVPGHACNQRAATQLVGPKGNPCGARGRRCGARGHRCGAQPSPLHCTCNNLCIPRLCVQSLVRGMHIHCIED